MGERGSEPRGSAPATTAALRERAARVSFLLSGLAEVNGELARGLKGARPHLADRSSLVSAARICSISDASVGDSAWVGILVLESPAVKRWQRLALVQSLVRRGVHRNLADLPSPGAASAGLLISMAAGNEERSRLLGLRHTEGWARDSASTAQNVADAALLAWTLDPGELDWIGANVGGGVLGPLVEFAGWLQAVERGEDAEPAPAGALSEQWFTCACFRGPRRMLARRRGTAAGRRNARSLERWVAPSQGPGLPVPLEGQGVVIVEWAIAAVRAWPDRERLLRAAGRELRERSDELSSSVAAHLAGLPGGAALISWLDASLKGLTVAADAPRTVRAIRLDTEAAAAGARST